MTMKQNTKIAEKKAQRLSDTNGAELGKKQMKRGGQQAVQELRDHLTLKKLSDAIKCNTNH